MSLPSNLSALGSGAFDHCSKLESITIPESISILESRVLWFCTGLKSVNLSEGLLEIGDEAFSGCSSLESLNIPPKVRTISENSFNNCLSLKTIIIEDGPDSLRFEVPSPAYYSKPEWFNSCPLDSVYIGRNIKYDFKPGGGYGTFFLSPFREKKTLRKVVFGENVTTIQNAMFSGCANLTSVDVPEEMDSIGGGAFSECENLTSFALPYGIKTIGSHTFYNCKSLGSIKIPESVSFIGESAFYGCEGLQSIDIPNSVNEIELKAFCCKNLSKIRFEDSDKHLLLQQNGGYDVFAGCPITDIYLGRNIINRSYNYIYSSLAYFKTPFNLVVGKNVTEIIGGTFAECEKILSATFEEGLDTLFFINDHNAYNSIMPFSKSAIDSVYMGRVIVGKDNYYPGSTPIPFSNVDSSFVMRIGNNINEIGNNCYSNWNIAAVIIPNNVMKIASTAFQRCYTLKNLTIEDGAEPLDFMEGNNFYACQLRDVYIGRNMKFSTNSPFNRNKEGIQKLAFGNTVTEIPNKAFYGLRNLNELTLPKNLKSIGSMSFYGCDGLTELTILGSVTEIGQQAFDLCRNLKTLRIDDGKEVLKFTAEPNNLNNAFQNSPLEDVYIGRNFSFNNLSPFAIFETLKSLTLGEEISSVQARSFTGCPNLKDVTSYSKVVPMTNDVVFTPSYLPSATLHVPHALYDEYKVANVWKEFGTIKNFEGLYNVIYVIDGDVFKTSIVEQNSALEIEEPSVREGYTFSGWSEAPDTMPEHDVILTGSYIPNKYALTYIIDGEVYKTTSVPYGTPLELETEPTKEGYTFSGWSVIPETMPADDVIVIGTYIVNRYQVTYMYFDEVLKTDSVEYGAEIPLPDILDIDGRTPLKWVDVPEKMPAYDIIIQADETDGIFERKTNLHQNKEYYLLNGQRITRPQRGINIVNGKKVLIK